MTEPASPAAPSAGQASAAFRPVLLAVLLGVLLAALDGTIVSVALPSIVGDLGGVEDTHWVITAYLLTATSSALLYGRASDVFGRRPLLLGAVGLFLLGSALCGAATGMGTLAAARAIQGFGGGGLVALAAAVIADLVPPAQRPRYIGLIGATFGLGGLLGPLLGGVLVDHADWRWVFYLNLPLGAVVLTLLALRLPPGQRASGGVIDVRGALLLAATVGFFLCWITRGQEVGYDRPASWLLGVAALVLAPAFLAAQCRSTQPILPLHLFTDRAFALTGAAAFCAGTAMFATIIFVPLFLQLVQQRSATSTGAMLTAMTLGLLLSSAGGGRRVARSGRQRSAVLVGTALLTLGLVLLAGLEPGSGAGLTVGALAVFGVGLGLVNPVLITIAQDRARPADLGIASAAVSFFRGLGGTVGAAVGAAVLTAVVNDRLGPGAVDLRDAALLPDRLAALPAEQVQAFGQAYADAATTVFWIAAAIAALAFACCALLPTRPTQPSTGDQYAAGARTNAPAPTRPAS